MLRALRLAALSLLAVLAAGCSTLPAPPISAADRATLVRQVTEAETAFAKTMADRDHAGFVSFLAEDTVFFSGTEPLRGKAAVAAFWKRFYEAPKAPFSWKPGKVEVLPDGRLAMSTGPVFNPDGKPVASFTSVWRQESPGVWRIVFDNGCNCPP
jgi:ketosteroid isomerase-like protein